MTNDQLRNQLNGWNVRVRDPGRAGIYFQFLSDARIFFRQTMSGNGQFGLGNDYEFVKRAVRSGALLSELADVLDFFTAAAVSRSIRLSNNAGDNLTYSEYFDQHIFHANQATYNNRVNLFFQTYPLALFALTHVRDNFQNNILEACRRIINDRQILTGFFGPLHDGIVINYLKSIKSTGSDFHKGGKQVLILTFQISKNINDLVAGSGDLKVVYKPSDIEIDCLITGNTQAVVNADNQFPPGSSLFEIINNQIQAEVNLNPNTNLKRLPTYRILPRGYNSTQNPINIRGSYGYIEYLSFDMDYTPNIFGFHPFASSDYMIFEPEKKAGIVSDFYTIAGQYSAIAATFGLTDLHFENLLVRKYLPHLIDLEASLIDRITNIVEGTLLFSQATGGITGTLSNNWEQEYQITNPDTQGQSSIELEYVEKWGHNRLWEVLNMNQKRIVAIDAQALNTGFNECMRILRSGAMINEYGAWLARMNTVVIRYIAYKTGEMRAIRNGCFVNVYNNNNNANAQPNVVVPAAINRNLADEYQNYSQMVNIPNPPDPRPIPNYLAVQQVYILNDINNLDIPVFYHRINTTEIVDSNSNLIAVPNQIQVNANMVNTNVGRNTFFATNPTNTNIRDGQLEELQQINLFNDRVQTLQNQIDNALNAQGNLPDAKPINFQPK